LPPVCSDHHGLLESREIGAWEDRLDTIAKLIAVATPKPPARTSADPDADVCFRKIVRCTLEVPEKRTEERSSGA